MARIDDYRNALALAQAKLRPLDLAGVSRQAGFAVEGQEAVIAFLDRDYRLHFDDLRFDDAGAPQREPPLQEQILLLHYLGAAHFPQPLGRWIAYREIPGAAFYHGAFVRRAIDPLKKSFGHQADRLQRLAPRLGGVPGPTGEPGICFRPLPLVPLQVVMHAGDEEFPPEAGILFDATVGHMLSPEDAAWLAGMLVYRLMALAR
jgi:hypothetical protein